ncbi:hypothetical protein [Xanthomarina sp. F2636L]|uniref:hypothetical protein n=1 Tax=Xanthomarina sp. F2636L TaxID=2996018 RepID=UPI00225E5588|nr:hypothetical protein [Xanthomarina sp. F2636L]MCX7552160.1 hypothetical protein [Xanthomarina sp. F2636L]
MKTNLLFLLLLVTLSISSQESFSEQTKTFLDENTYLNNVEKEKFYLHTNKTTYYAGEKIWFKAYIVEDSNNKPNLNTTNIFVNFYSSEKKLISSQLYYAEAGFAYGEMEIHPDLISGTYYMDIDTNKNRNFKSGSVIPIQILSTTEDTENDVLLTAETSIAEVNNQDQYNMVFFPESQTILKDNLNNIAFTIKNNQVPVKASGKIIDNKTGETVTRFMSDTYGMGKFNLMYNSSFSAVMNINGIEKSFALPQASPMGFIIQKKLQSSYENTTSFLLKTNLATSSNYKDESLILVLHRNGFAKSVAPIEINKEATSYQINFLNKDLFSGINTLTLFDKTNKPISEYSFWNEPENIELEVTQFQASTDSITLDFKMLNKLADANLSVSVLPEATISYNNQQNIITEFQLTPYLNDTGFNLANYYNKTNGNKHSMDLIVQTAKKNNQIQRNIASENDLVFQPEHGVKIRGSVNSKDKDLSKHKVMLSSTENNILSIKPLKGKNQFEFDSLMLAHPSKYKLALLNKKGEIEKANFYIYKDFNTYRPDSLLTKPIEEYSKTRFETVYTLEDEYLPLLLDEEVLDEVLVKTQVKSDSEILKTRIEDKVMAKGFSKVYIPDEKSFAGADLIFYFRTLSSIKVIQDTRSVVLIKSRGPGAGSLKKNGHQEQYLVYFDDIPMNDHSELLGIQMFDIASVTVNATGAGYGIQGSGGVIHIYSKTPEIMKGIGNLANPDIQISETEFGFCLPKETFKNSEIYFPNQTSEELYSTIDWIPNFYLNSKTPNYLTISTKKHKNIRLFINGMNANGQLIYKMVTITKESN